MQTFNSELITGVVEAPRPSLYERNMLQGLKKI